MMPLTLANIGEENMIKRSAESRKRENSLKIWDLSQAARSLLFLKSAGM